MRKRRESKIDPCDAPWEKQADKGFSQNLLKRSVSEKRSKKFNKCLQKPMPCNVFKKMSWSIVSKTFEYVIVNKHEL